jgi:hypothetical protein
MPNGFAEIDLRRETICTRRILANINLLGMQNGLCRCEEGTSLPGVLKESQKEEKMVVY